MPEVVFYALGGRSVEQKRALVKDFTDAVVKNYKVDPSAVTITIVEVAERGQGQGRRAVQRHGRTEELSGPLAGARVPQPGAASRRGDMRKDAAVSRNRRGRPRCALWFICRRRSD